MRDRDGSCRVEDIGVARGYWRVSRTSPLIIRCPMESQCLRSSRMATQCSEGSYGTLCQSCKPNYILLSKGCHKCKSPGAVAKMCIGVAVVVLLVIGAAYAIRYYTKEYFERYKLKKQSRRLDDMKRRSSYDGWTQADDDAEVEWDATDILDIVKRKFKIIASFYQVVCAIPAYYKAFLPQLFVKTVGNFAIFNFDAKELTPIGCIQNATYHQYYIMKVSVPVLLAIMIVVGCYWRPSQKDVFYELGLLVIFAIYPSLCGTCGETYRCLEDGDVEGTSWLIADYRVDCNSDYHKMFQTIDLGFMVLYPFGIPLFFLLLMYPHRLAIATRPVETEMPDGIEYLSILCEEYESPVWFWEVIECIRKYVTVSLAVVLFIGYESSQILFAIIVCILFNTLFIYCSPYISPIDDVLAYFCHLTLLFLFLIASYTRFIMLLRDALNKEQLTEVLAMEVLTTFAAILVLCGAAFGIVTAIYEFRQLLESGSKMFNAYIIGDHVQLIEIDGTLGPRGTIAFAEKITEYVTEVKYRVTLEDGTIRTVDGASSLMPDFEEKYQRQSMQARASYMGAVAPGAAYEDSDSTPDIEFQDNEMIMDSIIKSPRLQIIAANHSEELTLGEVYNSVVTPQQDARVSYTMGDMWDKISEDEYAIDLGRQMTPHSWRSVDEIKQSGKNEPITNSGPNMTSTPSTDESDEVELVASKREHVRRCTQRIKRLSLSPAATGRSQGGPINISPGIRNQNFPHIDTNTISKAMARMMTEMAINEGSNEESYETSSSDTVRIESPV